MADPVSEGRSSHTQSKGKGGKGKGRKRSKQGKGKGAGKGKQNDANIAVDQVKTELVRTGEERRHDAAAIEFGKENVENLICLPVRDQKGSSPAYPAASGSTEPPAPVVLESIEPLPPQNDEQADEIEALQAILDELCVVATDNRIIEIEVQFDLTAEGVPLLIETVNVRQEMARISFLPPILLQIELPADYPASCEPHFTMSSSWMSAEQLAEIADVLHTKWEEGLPVIYEYYDYIKMTVEEIEEVTLSGSSYVIMDAAGMVSDENQGEWPYSDYSRTRVRSLFVEPLQAVQEIMLHNDVEKERVFRQSPHDCQICFSSYSGNEFIKNLCGHVICKDCWESMCEMHIREGNLTSLKCPTYKCGELFDATIMRLTLPQEMYERFDRLAYEKSLEMMDDVAFCPRCEAKDKKNVPVICDKNMGECTRCGWIFCGFVKFEI